PHMTVAENMAFGLKMRNFAKDEIAKRVGEAAEILGLTPYLNRKPGALSGGQRQRVAVGRAIVRQPKLFLFDEPLSNLDAKMRVTMRAELIKLHKQLKASKMPATVVYVTHDQVEAMSMGDRLVVMKDGVVQQVGAPLEIYNHPANQFVAGFIGSPPMNFLNAELQQRGDSSFVVGKGFELKLPRRFNGNNRPVVFGIRPEDIHERGDRVSTASGSEPGFLSAKVEILEPLGGEVIATCSFGGNEIIARLSSRTLAKSDAPIELSFDVERAKLFDPANGEALA
ncbi:MAG: ATP-binding cassette domain-containing protein, partial [Acidobacteriota bacterium]